MKKNLDIRILERLFIAKAFLSEISVMPTSHPDQFTLARYILIAHDSAELVFVAIAKHIGCEDSGKNLYLMDYIGAIGTKNKKNVPHRDFFSALNTQRNNIKHQGLMPNVDQWKNVAERTYSHIDSLCKKFFKIGLDELDESASIQNEEIKNLIVKAKKLYKEKKYQSVLENLARALFIGFKENLAVRDMKVGNARAEDAIKLSAFGVNANEFLALQEFLPTINDDNKEIPKWNQKNFGHPANWTDERAEFCLKTVVDIALKIQNASWVPSPIYFYWVYDHKITALEDVDIVQEQFEKTNQYTDALSAPAAKKTGEIVVRKLSKGASLIGRVTKIVKTDNLLYALADRYSYEENGPEMLLFLQKGNEEISGKIEASKVKVTCIPRDNEFRKKYYPNLREIEWKPE